MGKAYPQEGPIGSCSVTASWESCSKVYQFFFLFVFLGPHLRHRDVPRLGVESELQLPTCTTATAVQDLSCVCDLHHSSQQCQILNPLNKARNRTYNVMVPSQIRFFCATKGTPPHDHHHFTAIMLATFFS